MRSSWRISVSRTILVQLDPVYDLIHPIRRTGPLVSISVRCLPPLVRMCLADSNNLAHPDPTIHPMKLKDFAKKLKDYYGWDENEFLEATQKKYSN